MKHNRTRVVLIILEIAITLAIVTNCVNVIMAERLKMSRQSGLDDAHTFWMRIRPFDAAYRKDGAIDNAVDRDVRLIAEIPGVQAVANTNLRWWEGGGSSSPYVGLGGNAEPQSSQQYYGTKDLIPAIGAKIIAGRAFREGDHGTGPMIDPATNVIISKALADTLFPDGNAVGRQIQVAIRRGETIGDPKTVVGVIEEFYNPFGMPGQGDVIADRVVLMPARVGSYSGGMSYQVRVKPGVAMATVMTEVEKRLAAADAGRVFEFLSTMDRRKQWFSTSTVIVTTMTFIIITLVAVTVLGLLGLTSLAVSERTKQIGTRRALGATKGDILGHFLIENWIVTTAGIVLGIIAAYALNFALVSQMTDVKLSWQLVSGAVLLLWVNGLVATLPPAWRAMMVAPAVATRSI
jgi:putative ABC transport system permease protein